MDSFEALVGHLLERQGYWVRRSVYVEITTDDRRRLDKPSLPRPQIDLVAYKPGDDELVLFEVKSYLDSVGVRLKDLKNETWEDNRYKLLTHRRYQNIVSAALKAAFIKRGLIRRTTKIRFGLAAGNTPPGDRAGVKEYAENQDWVYLGPEEIAKSLRELAEGDFFDSPFSYTAKMLVRNPR
jgi:hypothetical protein